MIPWPMIIEDTAVVYGHHMLLENMIALICPVQMLNQQGL